MDEWDKDYAWGGKKIGDEFCGRECYEFNGKLKDQFDDDCCEHCSKYLTLQCEYLEDFMSEIDGYIEYE
jgi:hypothetical protein